MLDCWTLHKVSFLAVEAYLPILRNYTSPLSNACAKLSVSFGHKANCLTFLERLSIGQNLTILCRVAEMMVTRSKVEDAIAFVKKLEESLDIKIG